MVITPTQFRQALGSLLAELEPRLFPVEMARCKVKLRLMPTIGLVRARHFRLFLSALSTVWLYTPTKRSDPLAGNTLADRLKVSRDGNAWLTMDYIESSCASLREWARLRNG
jgi:hypothetical protein